MESKTYGYIRVSSKDQSIDRQIIALEESEFKFEKEMIYIDKMTGKTFDRPQYKRLMKKLKFGDILVIPSIDRLGRNYEEMLEQWRIITKEKNVDIVVLDMPLLDTRQRLAGLTETFITDLVLQIFSYVAQVERDNARRWQREGIDAAMRRGVKFGRPKKEKPDGFSEAYERYMSGECTIKDAARKLHVAPDTFMKWAHERMKIENRVRENKGKKFR